MREDHRLLAILEQLIGFRTVTGDHSAALACIDYTEQLLRSAGLHTTRHNFSGVPSIVATTQRTKHPRLLLQAHLDVVPGDDALFRLRQSRGKLYGRGVYDMKFAAACFLRAAEQLSADGLSTDYGIMFTFDEETGGTSGVKYLLEQEGYGCDVCLLPDGGDDWRIEMAAKGGWVVRATAGGVSAHGSRPWEGDNAAIKLLRFLQAADRLAPAVTHADTTLVVTTMQSGEATNQVPDHAEATINVRFLTELAYNTIDEQLQELAQKHDIRLHTELYIQPIDLDINLPVVQSWERIVRHTRGAEAPVSYALSFGASDARFFAAAGIPAIVTRPTGGGAHASGEWLEAASLQDFYRCILAFIRKTDTESPTLTDGTARGSIVPKLPETVTDTARTYVPA